MTAVLPIFVLMLATEPLSLVSQATIEAQIVQLKSPNKAPNIQGLLPNYPSDFDHHAQKKVFVAMDQLRLMGQDAFEALIAHGDDKEYSYTGLYAAYVDQSVGEVCLGIIEAQVITGGRGYKAREGADGKYHVSPSFLYFSKYYAAPESRRSGFSKWYDDHKNKTLREMQAEALEWRIEQEKAIGFPDEKEREYFLHPLERHLAELKGK